MPLFDLNNNIFPYSQPCPLTHAIINHSPKLVNYDQEHATCIQWNKTFFKSSLCTSKEKKVVTLEFVVLSCWPPTPTKLLLVLDKRHSPSNQQSYLPSLFLFSYSPLPTTLTTIAFLSFVWPILFFPTSFVPTQEGKPSTSLLGQTLSFSIHPLFLLLLY
jgi:hypothetical protein